MTKLVQGTFINKRQFKLKKHLYFYTSYTDEGNGYGISQQVPKGFVTDGITLPRWFFLVGFGLLVSSYWYFYCLPLALLVLSARLIFPRFEFTTLKAATIHDFWLRQTGNWREANGYFFQELKQKKVFVLKRWLAWVGITLYAMLRNIVDKKRGWKHTKVD